MKVKRFKTHEKVYFLLLFLVITNRGGIYILKAGLWSYVGYEDRQSLLSF